MSTYKLTYFKDGAVGEPSRLLSYCGIEFEDIRLIMEEWPKHKPSMLFLCYIFEEIME